MGKGVDSDALEAATWYSKAAEQGHAAAEFDYAVLLLRGFGLNADRHKAVAYLKSAADKGLAPAQNRLAHLYANGGGVEKNTAEAAKWRILAKTGGLSEDKVLDELVANLTPEERKLAEREASLWKQRQAGMR